MCEHNVPLVQDSSNQSIDLLDQPNRVKRERQISFRYRVAISYFGKVPELRPWTDRFLIYGVISWVVQSTVLLISDTMVGLVTLGLAITVAIAL